MLELIDLDNEDLTVNDLIALVKIEDNVWEDLKQIAKRNETTLYKTIQSIKDTKEESISFLDAIKNYIGTNI